MHLQTHLLMKLNLILKFLNSLILLLKLKLLLNLYKLQDYSLLQNMLIFLLYLVFQKIYKNHFFEKYKNLNLHQKDLSFNFQVLSSNYDNLHYQNILKIDVENLISKLNINKKKSSFLLYKDYLLNLIPINFHFLEFNSKSINHQHLIFNTINYI